MVEKEMLYNYLIIGIIAVCIIAGVYIFLIKPATDKTQDENNFEENRDIFLARYCENLKFKNFTIEDTQGKIANGYCFAQDNPMIRVMRSFKLGYEKTDTGFQFFILQERKP
jgi:hypothetical protein